MQAYSVPDARPDGGGLRGLIPRLCTGLFDLITHTTASSAGGTVQVEVSYLEVYNEEIRDLLAPQQGGPLKVRESPTVGVVVQGLTRHVVESYEEVAALLADGNRIRTLAATDRNAQSSRSHTVFTLHLTQHEVAKAAGGDSVQRRVSVMNLVDLAGSESAKDFMASKAGDWQRTRLRETSHINRSLFMLGHCMALLASGKDKHRQDPLRGGGLMASGSGRRRQRDAEAYESDDSSVGTAAYSEASSVASAKALGSGHVPYRGSILTMLLKENLGGNARTTLLATLSPSEVRTHLGYAACRPALLPTYPHPCTSASLGPMPRLPCLPCPPFLLMACRWISALPSPPFGMQIVRVTLKPKPW